MNQSPVDNLLTAVGRPLHNWSSVEIQLATLFYTLSEIPRVDKGHAVFSAIISFDTRLDVVDRLMELFPADDLHKEMWGKLSERLSKFYKKRHELAHFSLSTDKGRPTISPFYSVDKLISGSARHLDLSQINERSEKFTEFQLALNWFDQYASISRRGWNEAEIKALPVPSLVVHIRALAAQSLEERKARAQ